MAKSVIKSIFKIFLRKWEILFNFLRIENSNVLTKLTLN